MRVNWHRVRWGLVIAFASLWILKEVVIPATAAALWSKRYMRLVVECDQAMEASWYFRQGDRISHESEITQLLACHDYDKTRKAMLLFGLPEQYLSWLGLHSLEIHQRPAEEYARQHRFTER